MMPQRMIILKHRRNKAGRHKTGCFSLRHRKNVYRTSYTLVERCLTRTSQISFESHLFTSYVNDDKLIQKRFLSFPIPLPLLSRLENWRKTELFRFPRGTPGNSRWGCAAQFSKQAEIMSELQSTGPLQRTLQGPQISVLISDSP